MTIEKGCDRVILEKSAKLYLAYLCVRKSDICFLFLFLFNNLEYIVLFIFYQIFWFYFIFSVPFFFLSQRDTRSPTKLLAFLTSKKKKKRKNWQKKKQITTKMECCFDSFSIYKKDDPFLHYLVMNEKLLWCNSRCAFVCFNQACLPAVTEYTVL